MKSLIKRFNFKVLILFVIISTSWVNLNHERWKNEDVIKHDIAVYYSYLPAVFIHHDVTLSFLKTDPNVLKQFKYLPKQIGNGNYVIKMTMGLSFFYLPFFGLAHLFAKLCGIESNGYSAPYQFAILFSSLFYFLIGLYYLRKILLKFFDEQVTLLTLFCICFSTNVFHYLTISAGLSHIVGFTLIAAFIYFVIKWHQTPNVKYSILLGLLFGLATLVRPINGLIVILFLMYNVNSFKSLILKFKFLVSKKYYLLLLSLIAFLIFIPQLLYWKFITGDYLFNSYIGEHFFFKNPHVLYGLFSFRKGWLIYTPIMTLALIGIIFLKKECTAFYSAILIFVIVYLYVVFSWWCWWYGGSFGQRALIDIYPLFAFPLAALLYKIKNLPQKIIYSTYVFIFLFTVLNLFQSAQAKYNIIHYDSMTRANYLKVFFTITKQPDREKYLQHPDYQKALNGEEEY